MTLSDMKIKATKTQGKYYNLMMITSNGGKYEEKK